MVTNNPNITSNKKVNIGLSGTGFIASGFFQLVKNHRSYSISHVLSRRPAEEFLKNEFAAFITNSIPELVEKCDIILECSGDAIFATDVIDLAFHAGRPEYRKHKRHSTAI